MDYCVNIMLSDGPQVVPPHFYEHLFLE
jgi:hypothetical protein